MFPAAACSTQHTYNSRYEGKALETGETLGVASKFNICDYSGIQDLECNKEKPPHSDNKVFDLAESDFPETLRNKKSKKDLHLNHFSPRCSYASKDFEFMEKEADLLR